MKATGIVRRVDELGRVVVPREIRRSLRIREGDPLEIFTDNGTIVFKKYSPIGELGEFAQSHTDALCQTLGHIALICDRDTVIAVSGGNKRDFTDRLIHEDVERVMSNRTPVVRSTIKGEALLGIVNGEQENAYTAQTIVPLVVDGESLGAIMLLSNRYDTEMGSIELAVCATVATFIRKQMEI